MKKTRPAFHRSASTAAYEQRLRLSCRVLVAQIANTVVVFDHALVLAFHDGTYVGRQFFVQGLTIIFLRHIFAALAFREDRVIGTVRHCRLDIDPAAMQSAAYRAAGMRFSA